VNKMNNLSDIQSVRHQHVIVDWRFSYYDNRSLSACTRPPAVLARSWC